jgi:hypothetical protein
VAGVLEHDLPVFLPASGNMRQRLVALFLVISLVKARNEIMEESGFLCPSCTSISSPVSLSLISFHGINLITVSDSVIFVVHSSGR